MKSRPPIQRLSAVTLKISMASHPYFFPGITYFIALIFVISVFQVRKNSRLCQIYKRISRHQFNLYSGILILFTCS